jgi:hypothetical protein
MILSSSRTPYHRIFEVDQVVLLEFAEGQQDLTSCEDIVKS